MKGAKDKDRQLIDEMLDIMTDGEVETVRKIIAAMIQKSGKQKRSS